MNFFKNKISEEVGNYSLGNIASMKNEVENRSSEIYTGHININIKSQENNLKNIDIYCDDELVVSLCKTISSIKSGIVQGISMITGTVFAIDFSINTLYINPNWTRLATLLKNTSVITKENKTYLSTKGKEYLLEGNYFDSGDNWVCTQKLFNKDALGKLCSLDIKYFLYDNYGKILDTATNFAKVSGEPVLSNSKIIWRCKKLVI